MIKQKDENSKQKILNTALKLFANKGFDGVSIREICKEAGVNLCMVSYYFGGKKELYEGIIQNLIEQQIVYAKTFMDFDIDLSKVSKKEKVELLFLMLDKFIEFFYSHISNDLMTLLVKEHQNPDFSIDPPVLRCLRKLLSGIFDKQENDRWVIYKTLSILSLVNSPCVFKGFSLRLLGQEEFVQEDIKIIKDNVKTYINALLKEAKID